MITTHRAAACAVSITLALACTTPVWAGPTVAEKCEAKKLKQAGKLTSCLLGAEAKGVLKDGTDQAKVQTCEDKFTLSMTKTEQKAEGTCPTEGDAPTLLSQLGECAQLVTGSLAGVRFVDNGDGTVTDTHTGLIWEQKVAGTGCTHCEVSRTWAATQDWLSELNRDGFAGKHEWAMPTPQELQESLDCVTVASVTTCTLDPLFGPAPTETVWTGFAGAVITNAQCVDMATGGIIEGPKDDSLVMGASRARVRNNAH